MSTPILDAREIADYERDGLLVIRGLFSADELQPLREAYQQDPSINGSIYGMEDRQGKGHPFCTWTEMGDDIIGMLPRMARVVETAEALLGEACYHWHSKFSIKTSSCQARVEWHQDYGSWYDDGLLFPQLLTMGLAIEPVTRANGCVQFIPGSHHLGRIVPTAPGGSLEPFSARVERAKERLGLVHVEMDVGDAVFFHCNVLHGSGLNETETERVMMFCSYNAVSNAPLEDLRGKNEEGAFMGISAAERAFRPIEKLDDGVLRDRAWRSAFSETRFNQPDWALDETYWRAVRLTM